MAIYYMFAFLLFTVFVLYVAKFEILEYLSRQYKVPVYIQRYYYGYDDCQYKFEVKADSQSAQKMFELLREQFPEAQLKNGEYSSTMYMLEIDRKFYSALIAAFAVVKGQDKESLYGKLHWSQKIFLRKEDYWRSFELLK